MDLLLNSAGDLDLTTNDFQLVDGVDAVRQELTIRYRFFLGEWFLDPDEGVPYFRDVLKKAPNEAQVRALLIEVARTTPGVASVDNIELDLDVGTRTLTVTLDLQADVSGALVYVPFVVEVNV